MIGKSFTIKPTKQGASLSAEDSAFNGVVGVYPYLGTSWEVVEQLSDDVDSDSQSDDVSLDSYLGYWQFYPDYDEDSKTLIYTYGECYLEGDERNYLYKNGTGKFYIKDDCLYWADDIDHAGDGYSFGRVTRRQTSNTIEIL